jgi:drug/metabolite transporter (DMT)-like permease
MEFRTVTLILASVGLSALAQITMKFGMSNPEIQRALAIASNYRNAAWQISTNFYVLLGIVLYALSAVLWLLVLAKLDVTRAYPFVALGFVVTMVLGYFILGEGVGFIRLAGTFLVILGVVLVAYS